jgi:16S rRNA (cytosine1407-C5)-methyltransferase
MGSLATTYSQTLISIKCSLHAAFFFDSYIIRLIIPNEYRILHHNVYLPDEFLSSIKTIMPACHDMEAFIAACQRPLRKSIRINTLKVSVKHFQLIATRLGLHLTPVPWCEDGFWLADEDNDILLGNSAEHLAGLFYIQEASSMMPVTALLNSNESMPSTVLDMAAAPGSKSTQIAAKMKNSGLLVANEFSSSRIKALHANIERCGIRNIALSQFDGRVFGGWLPEQFDAVLIDAPCSGEGIVRKDPSAMKNWSKDAIEQMADVQRGLIVSAFQALKPGGTLVYSTCTLSKEENHHICHYLQQQFPDAVEFESLAQLFPNAEQSTSDEGFLHIFPQTYDCEGFFVAKIRKLASIPAPEVNKRLGKFPFVKANSKQNEQLKAALKQSLDVDLPHDGTVWLRDKEVWLFPTAIEPMLTQFKFARMGIKIAETHKTGFKWQHQVATCLATSHCQRAVSLNTDQAREWFMGRDIHFNDISQKANGEVVVTYQEMVIGLGKWVNNRIKNGLPRELVKDKNLF